MCNRARNKNAPEPETLFERFGSKWLVDKPMDNRFNPAELRPAGRAYVVRENDRGRGIDVMSWDVLGGQAKWPMTNVRQLGLPQWKRLAAEPENRCLVPLTEFCEWTPEPVDLGDGKKPLKGEMWFDVTDQPMFAVAGFWQPTALGNGFTMVTCDANELVAPIHPNAMVTVLEEANWDLWLRGSYEEIVKLQRPYPAERMTVRGPVFPTRRVSVDPQASTA
ncbi:SOS response-associated peptidase family protein [Sphingomonas sp. OTU376]|uniref:SOS response-associated peptidase family protein n=1 Tax=Sphingomonas sp. OTU376 TaxID=3043863 RepID=UPI00313C21E2